MSGQRENLIRSVKAGLPDVTEEQVRMVLEAVDRVTNGRAVGTLLSDPASGAIALRVEDNGVQLWRVTAPDGSTWSDMQPDLAGWDTIKEP